MAFTSSLYDFPRNKRYAPETIPFAAGIAEKYEKNRFKTEVMPVTSMLIPQKTPKTTVGALTLKSSLSILISLKHDPRIGDKRRFMRGNSPSSYRGVNPEYEMYLHKTMIRDVYNAYRGFAEKLREKTLVPGGKVSFRLERLGGEMLKRFTEYVDRRVVYENEPPVSFVFVKPPRPSVSPENPLIRTITESVPGVEKKIEVENASFVSGTLGAVNRMDIENVMEQVYRRLEGKLRLERLRKGL